MNVDKFIEFNENVLDILMTRIDKVLNLQDKLIDTQFSNRLIDPSIITNGVSTIIDGSIESGCPENKDIGIEITTETIENGIEITTETIENGIITILEEPPIVEEFPEPSEASYPEMDDSKKDELFEKFKNLKIVVSATQYPGCGGSATNAYNIIKYMRKELTSKTTGIFFENVDKFPLDKYDPEKIGGIFRCPRWDYFMKKHDANFIKRDLRNYRKAVEKELGGTPDIILCKNYIAPLEIDIMFPGVPIVYLVSGSKHLSIMGVSYDQLLRTDKKTLDVCVDEVAANSVSTLIVPNSMLSYKTFKYIYPEYVNKISYPIDTSVLTRFKVDYPPMKSRQYDIGVFVSNHKRVVKNGQLANKILGSPRLEKYDKLIVGDNYESTFSKITNVTEYPMIPNTEVIKHLQTVKIILICSLFDASPNTCVEALCCGCKLLLTRNVGNSEKYNKFYIINDIEDVEEWVDKICTILETDPDDLPVPMDSDDDIKYLFAESINKVLVK